MEVDFFWGFGEGRFWGFWGFGKKTARCFMFSFVLISSSMVLATNKQRFSSVSFWGWLPVSKDFATQFY